MTDEESPKEAGPTESEEPTEVVGVVRTGPGSRDRTIKRVLIASGVVVVVTALAFTLTQVIRKDAPPAVQETAAAEVFLEPADAVGDSPFAPTSFSTAQPDPTNPGSDPLGPPPAAPPPPADGQAAPVSMRTANGDLPGLYGGTLDTTTCDAELMINYLAENPNKAKAWSSVHRINPDQIRPYVTELTPVLLRTDTRLTDHGYIEVGQAISRQVVLQAGTAVMVDKYGSPRVRCISGSPLVDPIAATAPAPPAARPAGNVVVQPAVATARPRVIYVGPRWPRFDPLTFVVIRRLVRAIEYFFLWDFRRGVFLARQIGILIRDIANLLDPRLRGLVPQRLLARAVPARPPVQLQPQRPVPQRPPVQRLPAQVPPVQQAPGARPPAPQAPPPVLAAPPADVAPQAPRQLPPIVDSWDDPPVYDPGPVYNPGPSISDPPSGHTPSITGLTPGSGGMPVHDPQPIAPAAPPPMSGDGTGTHVPAITDTGSGDGGYPQLPQAPSSGGHQTAPVPEVPAQAPQAPADSGSSTPDYGSLPGAADTGGDPGGNLQCDAVLNPC